MARLLLALRYLGTRYHGWQVQPNAPTIQETVQDAVESITGVRSGVTGCQPHRRRRSCRDVLLCVRYGEPAAGTRDGQSAQRPFAPGYRRVRPAGRCRRRFIPVMPPPASSMFTAFGTHRSATRFGRSGPARCDVPWRWSEWTLVPGISWARTILFPAAPPIRTVRGRGRRIRCAP